MTADEKHQRYKLTVPSVLKPFNYRLEIGDSQTQVYAVGVREKPVVESGRGDVPLPGLSGPQGRDGQQKGLDLEAPQYTVAELRLRPSVPMAKGYLESDGRAIRRARGRGRQAAGGSACRC